jgi:hypothetical protein
MMSPVPPLWPTGVGDCGRDAVGGPLVLPSAQSDRRLVASRRFALIGIPRRLLTGRGLGDIPKKDFLGMGPVVRYERSRRFWLAFGEEVSIELGRSLVYSIDRGPVVAGY